ncbi:exodeoxyribonuclease 7 large subunit [Clostridium sp. CAG:571]|nr:exodeoxyribonuclease 7 large subunit [Clostridium sp. CAG:571]
MQILGELEKKLLDYKLRYKLALKKKIEMMRLKYEKCMSLRVFKEPMQQINEKYILIDKQVRNLKEYITNKLKSEKIKEIELISKLDALSPLKTLTRGYSIVQKDNGIVKSSKDLKKGDEINIRFSDGNTNAKIL